MSTFFGTSPASSHLHQAYQILPDEGSRDRLLDAIDARNAFTDTLFEKGHQQEWSHVLFPFIGHDAKHRRLAYDGYQEPYANTCFNWDTAAMRQAPAPGKKSLAVSKTSMLPRGVVDHAIWSSMIGSATMENRSVFGEIMFE